MNIPPAQVELSPELSAEFIDAYDGIMVLEQLTEMFIEQTAKRMRELRERKVGVKERVLKETGIGHDDFENYHIRRKGQTIVLEYCEDCANETNESGNSEAQAIPGVPPDIAEAVQAMAAKLGFKGKPTVIAEITVAKPNAPTPPRGEPEAGPEGEQAHPM